MRTASLLALLALSASAAATRVLLQDTRVSAAAATFDLLTELPREWDGKELPAGDRIVLGLQLLLCYK